uniref:Uncharacterized protein n=1 Tax=Xenopus tropicalis TaxID=8364 RepID=A0A6I8R649_XENTR
MLKGIFLCVLLAVLSANSMAQPEGSADPDAMIEREIRGIWATALQGLKKFAKGGLDAIVNPKREAIRPVPFFPPVHAKKVFPLH